MAFKIDIKRDVEKFEIGSKTFELELQNEKLVKYNAKINEVVSKSEEARGKEDDLELVDALREVEEATKDLIGIFFGNGAYDEIFEEVNRSSYVMSKVIEQIVEAVQIIVTREQEKNRENKKQAYYKKKK
ncbi:hypothetical protein FLK61_34095 [Paenalkalicoccus suaedae]|uniref:Phage protein n=1 Tax=Paenalkalicoccus suaedae TaxID=2592382 RepID=A0A859FED6_9BACI|nr:hypothetical protein [Paenalkalicoccus suaedae]QKS71713.1 hypothetical protein FLK61_34095 [Paenalkalicoccus suaedae]